jgi:hypothetical protein
MIAISVLNKRRLHEQDVMAIISSPRKKRLIVRLATYIKTYCFLIALME